VICSFIAAVYFMLQVIHNYGHGAEGISLSWGTSVYAVKLAEEMLTETEETVGNDVKSKL